MHLLKVDNSLHGYNFVCLRVTQLRGFQFQSVLLSPPISRPEGRVVPKQRSDSQDMSPICPPIRRISYIYHESEARDPVVPLLFLPSLAFPTSLSTV